MKLRISGTVLPVRLKFLIEFGNCSGNPSVLHDVIVTSDDSRLIESALAGNTSAFGELVLKYQDRLFGALFHLLGSFHDARDVSQEAFLLAFQKLRTFRRDSSFYAWLFRIAYNSAINQRRKQKRKVASLNGTGDCPDFQPRDTRSQTDPASQLQTEEAVHQVRFALSQLAPEYHDALILKEIEGFRYEEIAVVLNCPVGTVRSRIHRARQMLRERLARVVEREQE